MVVLWKFCRFQRSHVGAFKRFTSSRPDLDRRITVSLVGRPNTGKSTLFNRLTGGKLAIVSKVPGTTRDRKDGKGNLAGLPLNVIDTGGFDDRGAVHLQIQRQVEEALSQSDVVLFMVDAKEGVTSLDLEFAKWLRIRIGKLEKQRADGGVSRKTDVVLVANKTEGAHLSDRVIDTISDALKLGLGEPLLISASHGDGMSDLAQALQEHASSRGLPELELTSTFPDSVAIEDRVIQLAVMGKPNVGKSTFINSAVGEERLITGPIAGLTRDSIHVSWKFKDRDFLLVDTAGLTKIRADRELLKSAAEKKKIEALEASGRYAVKLPGMMEMDPQEDPSQFSQEVSEFAVISALNALRFSQVVVLMVEGAQGKFSQIDLQIARKCLEEGRALVVVANKSDLVEAKGISKKQYEESVKEHCNEFFKDFGKVAVAACNSTEGTGVNRVLSLVIRTHDAWSSRVSTWVLNRWLKDLLVSNPPPRVGGKAVQLKYMTQVKSRPPTFAVFANTSELPGFFQRFLRSKLQQDMKLQGVPIRFVFRKSKGAEVKKTLLKQGKQSRTGHGHGSARPVGPRRKEVAQMHRLKRDQRRRRDSRLRRTRAA